MNIATYNIRRGIGSDGVQDIDRVASVIRDLDVDVIGLQEVDSEVSAEGFEDQLQLLAAATRTTPVAGPALVRDYGGYGNGLLTRLRVASVRRHDISVDGREPRGILDVVLEAAGGPLRVVNTHLGRRSAERRRQCGRLVSVLESGPPGALVLMGDFNEWVPFSRVYRRIEALLGPAPRRRSYPSRFPLIGLDRLWARPPARLDGVIAVRTRLSRRASDHLPVMARVDPG